MLFVIPSIWVCYVSGVWAPYHDVSRTYTIDPTSCDKINKIDFLIWYKLDIIYSNRYKGCNNAEMDSIESLERLKYERIKSCLE